MHLDGHVPLAATAADKVAVQGRADINETLAEPLDQSGHIEVSAVPAFLARRIQAIVVGGQVTKRFDADCLLLHASIEARPAADGKRAFFRGASSLAYGLRMSATASTTSSGMKSFRSTRAPLYPEGIAS